MRPRIIKTESQYDQALVRIKELLDSVLTDIRKDELELLSTLVEMYEEKEYKIELPDPIDAIKFRMEQANLKQNDLSPFIGSKSKVSEVLNRKRSLSLAMIRSLKEGLDIPAEVLIQKINNKIPTQKYSIQNYPFNEMFKRGYFDNFTGTLSKAKDYAEEVLTDLFDNSFRETPKAAYFRKANKASDEFAIDAWIARIQHLAAKEALPAYKKEKIDFDFLSNLSKLSVFKKGPGLAMELLNRNGIHLIILQHLPKTYFDGAVLFSSKGNPVIGMTLRYGRVDNFWFTLLHEMSHVLLHLNNPDDFIIDDLDAEFVDAREIEANELGQNALIKPTVWDEHKDKLLSRKNVSLIRKLSDALNISPAIIAGRVRRAKKDYSIYSEIVKEDIRYIFQN